MKRKKRSINDESDENTNESDTKKFKNNDNEECLICQQKRRDIKLYGGHLNKSCEEFVALTDEKLSLFTGNEQYIAEEDELPTHKITHFTVYDKKGHLCSFDNGLVEKNVLLYLSGYIKPIYDEDSSSNNGIPAHDMGPINEWYITGFDGGLKAIVGVVTAYAQYILMEPSEEYAPFVKLLRQKMTLVKIVIEFLTDHAREEPTYEDLVTEIKNNRNSEINEDFLLEHAQFVCDQIFSYDEAGDEDDNLQFVVTPCVRTLVQLAGVTFRNRKKMRQTERKAASKKIVFTKAATTPLVKSIFENFFPDQIESEVHKLDKKRRCGVCDACQAPDCGKCANCKAMVKFGGNGKSKQACKMRRCPNMAIQETESSENEDEDVKLITEKKKICSRRSINTVQWFTKPIFEDKSRKYFFSAIVDDFEVTIGDYVMLTSENPNEPLSIAKVEYMFDKFPQGPTLHALIFYRGSQTILGETADPQELFYVNMCEECPLGSIVRKANVILKRYSKDWFHLGGTETLQSSHFDGSTFYFSKTYSITTGTFSDYDETPRENSTNVCWNCYLESEKKRFETPVLEGAAVTWRGETYRSGTSVFLNPSVYNFSCYQYETSDNIPSIDETVYTEYYRKTGDVQGSNLETPEPFCIGLIEDIWGRGCDIKIKARIFFRPENTRNSVFLAHESDLHEVYWSDETVTVPFKEVVAKCYLTYFHSVDCVETWSEQGPYRFYFTRAYDPRTFNFAEVPDCAKKMGYSGKGKAKGKSHESNKQTAPLWDEIDRPLLCMDVFAGCGGLSYGLHKSGVAVTKWAIENEPTAAKAFKLNNEDCLVFNEDCNSILQQVLSGEGSKKGLPSKGEVEMLVGGPPCQGFSGMNRFNAGQYSLFKNSLVVTFLSFCDYYRPKIFVLENVRNFVSFKKSMVLKLTLRCLLAIGYQVTFGILQAGHYGLPQTRRRLVLIAAAPGYVLPKLPEPQHVFSKRGCNLCFALDGVKYTNGNLWTESAPYRTICVRDAISDLPDIRNGWDCWEMSYDASPVSHFQRKLRNFSSNVLVDHVCKEMAPIVAARISHIPKIPGSDWRDLPNISVELSDGTTTNVLKYPYFTKKQKKGEPNRGVCRCSVGKPCEPTDRQMNTLIPWCLPHTADRHNHWGGLYGRIEWDGYFGTTITNPEPMGKQGRVLHPDQNRVVSVRECARSQGFPDDYQFCGSVMDKHRQVGNAVPPPMGRAIGMEIKKALARVTERNFK